VDASRSDIVNVHVLLARNDDLDGMNSIYGATSSTPSQQGGRIQLTPDPTDVALLEHRQHGAARRAVVRAARAIAQGSSRAEPSTGPHSTVTFE
jgi:hypothetical protein